MKHTLAIFCCVMFLCGTLLAQDTASVADRFTTQLADMQSDDANKVRNAHQDWQRICFEAGAPGNDVRKAEVVKLMTLALEKDDLKDAAKYWLLRQLGRLDNGDHAALIGKFVADRERTVRDEAIGALANIPSDQAGRVLEELLGRENNADRKLALQNALNYRARQKTIDLPKLDEIVKSLETGDLKASEHVLSNLYWLVDVRFSDVPNYRERFAKLAPQAQVLLTDALVARRDKSIVPLALEMVKSDEEQVRFAGFRALGPLGDPRVVPVLLENILGGGDLTVAVRDSLARLNFDGADKMLLDEYSKTDNNRVKVELTRVFRTRAGTIAVPVCEAGLKSDDEDIRRISIEFLEAIGQQSSILVLVDRYFAEEKRDIRDPIERAILRIEARNSDVDDRGKMFCDTLAKRSESEQVQLLPLAGRIGGSYTRTFVLAQLTTGTPAIREAAFRALCDWTDVAIADDLLTIASSQNDPRAPAAARSYIRIVTLHEEGRNDRDKFAYVEKAMSVAKSDEDKQFLLSRLDQSRCIEVFRLAVEYIDNPNLEQVVYKAIVDLANDTGFHMRHREEIEPYLDIVIEKSTDNGHVDRARRYKERR